MMFSVRSLPSLVGAASSRRAMMSAGRSGVPSSTYGLRWESSSSSSSSAAPASTEGKATHYRITLRRSGIGMPAKINRSLESLGLKKRLQSVYRPIGPDMAGAILAVKELVHVDNVRRLDETPEQVALSDAEATWVNEAGEVVDFGKSSRKAPRGYRLVGNMVNEERDQMLKEQEVQFQQQRGATSS